MRYYELSDAKQDNLYSLINNGFYMLILEINRFIMPKKTKDCRIYTQFYSLLLCWLTDVCHWGLGVVSMPRRNKAKVN